MESEVNRLREKIAELVPEAGVAPLDHWTVLEQVLEVSVVRDLLGRDVLQLDKDHLGVIVHDAGNEGGADLGPLKAEVGPGEHNEGPGAGLHCH